MKATIVSVSENSILVVRTDADARAFDQISIGTAEIPLFSQTGEKIEADHLKSGMSLEISYDGMIMESYPAQIQAAALRVTGEEASLVSLYLNVLKEWYEEDPALNDGITMMGFDLSGVNTLTEGEKNALIYLMGCEYDLETLSGTYEELCDANYIDREELYWEEGILFSLTDEGLSDKETSFTFSVSKWRSGSGAIGSSDCTATLKDGVWEYKIGAVWIS